MNQKTPTKNEQHRTAKNSIEQQRTAKNHREHRKHLTTIDRDVHSIQTTAPTTPRDSFDVNAFVAFFDGRYGFVGGGTGDHALQETERNRGMFSQRMLIKCLGQSACD